MKITFNVNKERFEEHTFNFLESTAMTAMVISGIAFWIIATVVLLDPIYR